MATAREWVTTYINQVVPTEATPIEFNQRWWLVVFAGLLQAAGVTVWKSCNGVAVVVGSSNIATLADIVFADPSTDPVPRSWIVLRFANGGQLLITFVDSVSPFGQGAFGRCINMYWSAEGSFSGGTTTVEPTAIDQELISGDNMFLSDVPAAGDYVVNVTWTTDGKYVLLNSIGRGVNSDGNHLYPHLFVVTLDDVVNTAALYGKALAWCGCIASSGQLEFNLSLRGHPFPLESFGNGAYLTSSALTGDETGPNPYRDNRKELFVLDVWCGGRMGRLRDIYAIEIPDAAPNGEIYVTEGGQRWARMGTFVIPWSATESLQYDGNIAPVPVPESTTASVPTSQVEANALLGFGDWNHGHLCNDAATQDSAAWGGADFNANNAPLFQQPGFYAGDLALSVFVDNFFYSLSSAFDIGATDDFAFAALIVNLQTGVSDFFDIFTTNIGSGDTFRVRALNGKLVFGVRDDDTFIYTAEVDIPTEPFGLIAVLDRGSNMIRLAVRTVSGVTTATAEYDVSAIGAVEFGQVTIGNGGFNAGQLFTYTHWMVAKGVGAAAGLSANIDAAITEYVGSTFITIVPAFLEPPFTAPLLTVAATFSANFRTARNTLWAGTLESWPVGGEMIVIVRYSERNETITARDAEGNWCWPFDVVEDNVVNFETSPVTVQLRPRGGWPPCDVEIQIAAAKMAQVA